MDSLCGNYICHYSMSELQLRAYSVPRVAKVWVRGFHRKHPNPLSLLEIAPLLLLSELAGSSQLTHLHGVIGTTRKPTSGLTSDQHRFKDGPYCTATGGYSR